MLMLTSENVISRHRLPQPYRAALAALWLLPPMLLLLTLTLVHGGRALSVLLPLTALALPALYVWREGVDVTPTGIIRRIHLPTRRYGYAGLAGWIYDEGHGVLRVWDRRGDIALECRAAHLTEFERLRATLAKEIR